VCGVNSSAFLVAPRYAACVRNLARSMATEAMQSAPQGRDRGPNRAIPWSGKIAIFAVQQISQLCVYCWKFSKLTVKLLINSSTVSMQF
jgi:hypothetical protein